MFAAVPGFGADGETIKMDESVEFPHAGIALSLPEGFEFRQPAEQFNIMRAVKMQKICTI